jgi:hypothetical protein
MQSNVNNINFSSTTTPVLNVTNIYGSKFLNPWEAAYSFPFNPPINNTALVNIAGFQRSMPYYSWNTLPFISSSNGWVNLPTLGANPCPTLISSSMPYEVPTYWNNSVNLGYYNWGQEAGYLMYFPNLTASSDWFQIYTVVSASNGYSPSINIPTPGQMIYQYSASIGTVYSSSFFENGSPTVIIDPWPNC